MVKTELEPTPTFEEKLACFATAFVPELVSTICKLAKEAQENPMIVYLLDQWYDNSTRAQDSYKASILEALQSGEEFTRSAMIKIYQDKAYSARDFLMDYFRHNGFKK